MKGALGKGLQLKEGSTVRREKGWVYSTEEGSVSQLNEKGHYKGDRGGLQ